MTLTQRFHSRATEGSILAVQVFDQKKFKKKDQGFLGVINIRVGDVLPDLGPDADGAYCSIGEVPPSTLHFANLGVTFCRSNDYQGFEEINR